jgi:hypothetical protein
MAQGQGQSKWGIEYLPIPRHRRGGGATQGGGSALITSPGNITTLDTASVGDVLATLAVSGGTGVYTFSLTSNPGGLFSIAGNQLKVAASLSAGTDPITIRADNGAGDTPSLPTAVMVTHVVLSYSPTFFILGF